ncbi:MAG: large-conductance mechanosensitive channel protein MscL [Rudaea sp.]
MGFFSEFKTFAMKGNVVDMATGIVIGAAFGKIVASLVENVIMPPIGVLIGGIDFSSLAVNIGNPVVDAKGLVTGGAIIKYGVFLNTIIQFIIVALAIFLVIKFMNRMVKKQEAAPAAPAADVVLLTEIRDLLKQQKTP